MCSQWHLHYQGPINCLQLSVYSGKTAWALGGYVFLMQLMSRVTADTCTLRDAHTFVQKNPLCTGKSVGVQYASFLPALSIIKVCPIHHTHTHVYTQGSGNQLLSNTDLMHHLSCSPPPSF